MDKIRQMAKKASRPGTICRHLHEDRVALPILRQPITSGGAMGLSTSHKKQMVAAEKALPGRDE